jgi:hypothetical protein
MADALMAQNSDELTVRMCSVRWFYMVVTSASDAQHQLLLAGE